MMCHKTSHRIVTLLVAGATVGACDLISGQNRPAAVQAAPASRPTAVSWGQPVTVPIHTLSSQQVQFSQSGGAGTFLFTGLELSLQGQTAELAETQSAAVRVPLQIPKGKTLVGFHTDIRGSVTKKAGARAVLLIDAGATKVIEFPYGGTENGRAITQRVSVTQPSTRRLPPVFCATLTLAIQRHTANDTALLTVDSLDVTPILR